MNHLRKARLQREGWAVGETDEFLNLSAEEAQFVELKLAPSAGVRSQVPAHRVLPKRKRRTGP
jgi:hypothetical protein